MMGSLLHRRLAARNDPEAEQAKQICDLLNTGVHEARNLSHGLHPVKAEGDGLMKALRQYAKTATNLFHIRCSFRCGKSVVIESQVVATNLFRIAQEALNNARRHGEASRVLITLKRGPEGITLAIRDNGIGIPLDLPRSGGMGMQIMNHRATAIGAMIEVQRAGGCGTVVRCSVPC
jgi:signal transduction histidine kinase